MDASVLLQNRALSIEPRDQHEFLSRTAAIVGNGVITGLSIVLIALRFLARRRCPSTRGHHGLWWDDWTALVALFFFLIAFIIIGSNFKPFLGRNLDSLSLHQKGKADYAVKAFSMACIYCMGFARCSGLLFYHRLFITDQKSSYRYFLDSLQLLNLFIVIVLLTMHMFNCRLYDTPKVRTMSGCLSDQVVFTVQSAGSFMCDLLVLLAPIPKVVRLHLPSKKTRMLVAIPFLFGIIVVSVSLGRLITTAQDDASVSAEVTFSGVYLLFWRIAEIQASLLSICLPVIYGFIRNWFTNRRALRTSTYEDPGLGDATVKGTSAPHLSWSANIANRNTPQHPSVDDSRSPSTQSGMTPDIEAR